MDAARGRGVVGQVPRLLTIRALVLFVVLLVAFVLLFPTVRGYLAEREHLQTLRAEAAGARERTEDLEAEIGRWQDPAFVAAQARERLAYVLPGETPYRVIDPQVAVTPEPEPEEPDRPGTTVPDGASGSPWYSQMWSSVVQAGEMPAQSGTAPEEAPVPTGDAVGETPAPTDG